MTYQFKIGQRVKCISKSELSGVRYESVSDLEATIRHGYLSPEGIGYIADIKTDYSEGVPLYVVNRVAGIRAGNYFLSQDLIPEWSIGDTVIIRDKTCFSPLSDLIPERVNVPVKIRSVARSITRENIPYVSLGFTTRVSNNWQEMGFSLTDLEWVSASNEVTTRTSAEEWINQVVTQEELHVPSPKFVDVPALTAKEAKAKFKQSIYNAIKGV